MRTTEVVARTAAGAVRGAPVDVEAGSVAFLGIPYAAAPVGSLRFAAPQPPPPWDGVREAVSYGASALQPHRQFTLVPEPVIPGPDCLNLNVFSPDPAPGAGLPVLVWIHGGGFTAGSNASPWYRGHRFNRDGVVVVSVNYRLGLEGFLAVDDAPAPRNRAVLDWVSALTWVRDNIAAFGGDPDQVTVAGQSAGGVACGTLLAVPAAAGLFRRAILMSGAAQWLVTPDGARAQQRAVAEVLGTGGATTAPATAAALAALDTERFLAVQDDLAARQQSRRDEGLPRMLAPVVDGEIVATPVLDVIATGRTQSIDVMVGVTAEEVNGTAVGGRDVDHERLARRLARLGFSDAQRTTYVAAPGYAGRAPHDLAGQAVTDVLFRAPAARVAEARAEAGAPVFAYEFQWATPALGGLGACHCLDIPFAFDVLDADGAPPVTGDRAPQSLADEMHGAFTRFVVDGDPGWPAYDTGERLVRVFDDPPRTEADVWRVPRTVVPTGE